MKASIKLLTATSLLLVGVMIGGATLVDGNGVEYTTTKNQHGVVLKSRKATIYLGKGCDAYSPQYGKGTWGWANGGVLVELSKKKIGFARQESPFGSNDSRCLL